VPEVLTRKGENYVLRVNGSSMIEDGIHDGDFVVVNRRERAQNGEMVAALVNGEATLKRYYRESDGRIRLQPANERMSPIFVNENELKVQGVVVGLMRRY
jgi:repressor LexA